MTQVTDSFLGGQGAVRSVTLLFRGARPFRGGERKRTGKKQPRPPEAASAFITAPVAKDDLLPAGMVACSLALFSLGVLRPPSKTVFGYRRSAGVFRPTVR